MRIESGRAVCIAKSGSLNELGTMCTLGTEWISWETIIQRKHITAGLSLGPCNTHTPFGAPAGGARNAEISHKDFVLGAEPNAGTETTMRYSEVVSRGPHKSETRFESDVRYQLTPGWRPDMIKS